MNVRESRSAVSARSQTGPMAPQRSVPCVAARYQELAITMPDATPQDEATR